MSRSLEKTLFIDDEDMQEIRSCAREAYPGECCGILGGTDRQGAKSVSRIFPALNLRRDNPQKRYLISPSLHRTVDRSLAAQGLKILGFFHSHPDSPARPSDVDREYAWPWYSYLIVSVGSGTILETRCWVLRDDRSGFQSERLETGSGMTGLPPAGGDLD